MGVPGQYLKKGALVGVPPSDEVAIIAEADGSIKSLASDGTKTPIGGGGGSATLYEVGADVQDFDVPIAGAGDYEIVYEITGANGLDYTLRANGLTTNQSSCLFINNGAAVTPLAKASDLYMNDVSTSLTATGRIWISNFAGKRHQYVCTAFRTTVAPAQAQEITTGAWAVTDDLTKVTIHSSSANGIKAGSWFAVIKKA